MQPGFLHKQLPTEAPQQGEKWDVIMKDVEDKIVPGAFQRQIWIADLGSLHALHITAVVPAMSPLFSVARRQGAKLLLVLTSTGITGV